MRRSAYGEGDLPTYTLGAHLDQLLSPGDRQVGTPQLPAPPTICEVSISRRRLTLKVRVDRAASAGRLSLAAWLPGSPDFVDLGTAASRAGSTLTFKISPRRLLHDKSASSDGPSAGLPHQRQWVLLLRAERKGRLIAASPVMVPSETLRPAAARDGRNPRLSNPGRRHAPRVDRRNGEAAETDARVASSPLGCLRAHSTRQLVPDPFLHLR